MTTVVFEPIFRTLDGHILAFRSITKQKKSTSTPTLSLSLEDEKEPKEKFSIVLSYTNIQKELYEIELRMDELKIMVNIE